MYVTPYHKPKLQISCFSENSSLQTNLEETEQLENDYLNCYDKPLLSIKNLGRYDCWEDKDWNEWVEICKQNTKEYDGISPMYENNE
jgi:hypothetical protein